MSTTILTKVENGIFTITFNRPEVYHAFNSEMAAAMQRALDDAERDEKTRVILVTATGKAFCSGQDLKDTTDVEQLDLRKIVRECYNPIVTKMRNIEKPIVVAVNGVAAGAGANLALAGDIVVAKDTASFVQAFSKIGLIPDCGGTFFLPRLIGWGKASALMMMGDKVSGIEAAQMGMIYKSFDDANYENEINKICSYLAQMPTKAFGYTKKALNESITNNLSTQLSVEMEYQGMSGATEDFKEGVTAFVEKRNATFIGK